MIQVHDLSVTLGSFRLTLDLEVRDGELLSVLGPSGSGKSTLLSILAGFVQPDAGSVWFGDTDVTNTPIEKRNIGFVFQDYALFEHLTVDQNIEYGLKRRRWDTQSRAERVAELMHRVDLTELSGRSVGSLSGGERQRVALARALAPSPALLLLDEPLSALDAALRRSLRSLVREIQQSTGTTTVYVTHDQEEALSVSDRIAVLREGQLRQIGPPEELYKNPVDTWTARFLGRANCVDGTVAEHRGDHVTVDTLLGELIVSSESLHGAADAGTPVSVFFRPEWLRVGAENGGEGDARNTVGGRVARCEYNGRGSEVTLDRNGIEMTVWLFDTPPPPLGSELTVVVPADRIRILPAASDR